MPRSWKTAAWRSGSGSVGDWLHRKEPGDEGQDAANVVPVAGRGVRTRLHHPPASPYSLVIYELNANFSQLCGLSRLRSTELGPESYPHPVLRQNVKRPIVGCFHRPRVMMSGQLDRVSGGLERPIVWRSWHSGHRSSLG